MVWFGLGGLFLVVWLGLFFCLVFWFLEALWIQSMVCAKGKNPLRRSFSLTL